MGVFDQGGQSKAEVFVKSKWFQEGTYAVRIKNCIEKKGRKGDFYIVETEVLYADSEREEAPSVGQQAAYIMSDNDMLLSNIMAFMCALADVSSPAAYSDEKWQKLGSKVFAKEKSGKASVAIGTCMRLDCIEVDTQSGGKYTNHNWSLLSDADAEKFGVDTAA